MIKKIKHLGFLVTLTMLTVIFITIHFSDVEATNCIAKSISFSLQLPINETQDLVFEDKICDELLNSKTAPKILGEEEEELSTRHVKKKSATSTDSNDGSYAKVIGVLSKNKGVYEVIVGVYAGYESLREGDLLLTSDTFRKIAHYPKVQAGSFVTIKTKMPADDPRSIRVEILTYELDFEPPICYQRDICDF